jgi:magnesium-transporting ATPase (P-type)
MSIILRKPDRSIVLYCKGADDVIMKRSSNIVQLNKDLDLCNNNSHINLTNAKEILLNHLKLFSTNGLRTLLLSQRSIDEIEFNNIYQLYASTIQNSNSESEMDRLTLYTYINFIN